MISYTCDLCGKPLLVDEDVRYVVRVEVKAAYDPLELTREDLEKDHLAEIRKLVERMEGMDQQELEDQVFANFRFDLCPTCQKRYLQDPLFRQLPGQVKPEQN